MIKVLASALIGTVIGIVVMVVVIVLAGTHTENSSSVGLSTLSITTAATATSSSSSSSGGPTGSTGSGGGNADNGKTIFTGSAGCSSCHTFTAAGATGTIGPNLDSLSADAQKAGEPLDQFIQDSIVNPDKFIASGFSAGTMPTTFGQSLSSSDIADLVAFLSQNQKK